MNKLIKGTETRFNRKNLQTIKFNRDIDELVSQFDSAKLIGQSRALYHNNPLVKAAIDKKASYTCLDAFEYRSDTKDSKTKEVFENAIKQWSKIAEVSGKTLNDVVYLSSVSLDVDGDVFCLLSETSTGYPVVQLIEAHAIGSRKEGKIDQGKYYEEKGVLYDKKTKRPIFYRVLGSSEDQDSLVSVANIVRFSEPSFSVRGIPLVSSAIRLLQDLEQSQELLLTQHLLAAAISMIEHNETGSEFNLGDDGPTNAFNVETINNEGGEIRYYKAGSGSKLEILNNPNPSLHWQEYQDTLTNMCLLALDWPKNLVGMSDSTGVNDRLSIQQAQKSCNDRKSLLTPFFQRICNWAIAKLIKGGFLDLSLEELPEDWFECHFTQAKFISVDLSRDSKAIQEEYKMGLKNLSQILSEEGREYDQHVRERMTEEAIRQKIKDEVEKEYGVKIDDLNVRLLNPTQFQNLPSNEQL